MRVFFILFTGGYGFQSGEFVCGYLVTGSNRFSY